MRRRCQEKFFTFPSFNALKIPAIVKIRGEQCPCMLAISPQLRHNVSSVSRTKQSWIVYLVPLSNGCGSIWIFAGSIIFHQNSSYH